MEALYPNTELSHELFCRYKKDKYVFWDGIVHMLRDARVDACFGDDSNLDDVQQQLMMACATSSVEELAFDEASIPQMISIIGEALFPESSPTEAISQLIYEFLIPLIDGKHLVSSENLTQKHPRYAALVRNRTVQTLYEDSLRRQARQRAAEEAAMTMDVEVRCHHMSNASASILRSRIAKSVCTILGQLFHNKNQSLLHTTTETDQINEEEYKQGIQESNWWHVLLTLDDVVEILEGIQVLTSTRDQLLQELLSVDTAFSSDFMHSTSTRGRLAKLAQTINADVDQQSMLVTRGTTAAQEARALLAAWQALLGSDEANTLCKSKTTDTSMLGCEYAVAFVADNTSEEHEVIGVCVGRLVSLLESIHSKQGNRKQLLSESATQTRRRWRQAARTAGIFSHNTRATVVKVCLPTLEHEYSMVGISARWSSRSLLRTKPLYKSNIAPRPEAEIEEEIDEKKLQQAKQATREFIQRQETFLKQKAEQMEHARAKQMEEEISECTFKPTLHSFSSKQRPPAVQDETKPRYQRLYELGLARNTQRQEKKSNATQNLEDEQLAECTFQPTVGPKPPRSRHSVNSSFVNQDPSSGLHIARQEKAREKRRISRLAEDMISEGKNPAAILAPEWYAQDSLTSLDTFGRRSVMRRDTLARLSTPRYSLAAPDITPQSTDKVQSGFRSSRRLNKSQKHDAQFESLHETQTEHDEDAWEYNQDEGSLDDDKDDDTIPMSASSKDEQLSEGIFIDVNLHGQPLDRLTVYSERDIEHVTNDFCQRFGLSIEVKNSLIATVSKKFQQICPQNK